MLQAVIFDMDGVLLDSEEFICEAAMKMFAEKGVEVKAEDFIPFVGQGENRYLGGVAEQHGVELDLDQDKKRTYEIYNEIVKGRLGPLPGVYEFINQCKKEGIRTAVASSADKTKVLINLRELNLSQDSFAVVVNGLDIERKKPHPDIFLYTSEQLHVKAENCLVVEDAPSGVQAAKAAGMKCLALTTSFTQEELEGADWYAETLATAPAEVLEW